MTAGADSVLAELLRVRGAEFRNGGAAEPPNELTQETARAHARAYVDALLAVGDLTPEEAKCWLEKFEDVFAGKARVGIQEVAPGKAHAATIALEREFAALQEAGVEADEQAKVAAASRLATFIGVYTRLGFISDQQRELWQRKLLESFEA